MKAKNPNRNRIPLWHWGHRVEVHLDPNKAPRWIRCRSARHEPGRCDVAGCEAMPVVGEWYVRHPFLGVVCRGCAPRFGVIEPGV